MKRYGKGSDAIRIYSARGRAKLVTYIFTDAADLARVLKDHRCKTGCAGEGAVPDFRHRLRYRHRLELLAFIKDLG